MTRLFQAAVIASALCVASSTATAQQSSERRALDARVSRIALSGVIDLQVSKGPVASMTVSGGKRLLPRVATVQKGELLTIGMDQVTFSGGPDEGIVKVHLTLPNLSELISTGLGSSTLTGVSGNAITLVQKGAGSITMSGNYKVMKLRLGGVGAMKIESASSDEVDVALAAASKLRIKGQAKMLRASLEDLGTLDASELHADAVDLKLSGAGSATAHASNSANVSLSGKGSATVYGKPARRTSSDQGMGSINWN